MCIKCQTWLSNCDDICQSPLLHHLNDAEHENVTLRNDVHVGKISIECNHCGLTIEVVVGFASVEPNSVAVVLSRQTDEPCNMQSGDLTDSVYFSSYMIQVPGTTSRKPQSENRICIPHTSFKSLESQDKKVELPPRFANGTVYANFFNVLLKLESNFQKNLIESSRKQINVSLRWEDLPNRKACAYFIVVYEETDWKPTIGEKLKLRRIGNDFNWNGTGRIIKLPQNYDEEMGLELETSVDMVRCHTTGFSVSRVWISTAHDRMVSALEKFALGNLNNQNPFFEQILGIQAEKPTLNLVDWTNYKLHPVSSLPPLSVQQENTVKNAIQRDLTLVQGPTASGKTTTLLSIVFHLVQQSKGRILVCAPTNSVVDHLALSIQRIRLEVVRLYAETRSFDGSPAQCLSLESKVRNQLSAESRKLQKSLDEGQELLAKDSKKLRDERKKAERSILGNAEVVCCTCIAAGDERLRSEKFHAILIDEAMQATEPDCIIPISLGCGRLILVGDHFQLNPVIRCKEASKSGLNRSLFKRLVDNGVQPLQLTVQYRMHPKLWHFPSTQYTGSLPNGISAGNLWHLPSTRYPDSLPSGVSAAQRKLPDQVLPWPVPEFPFMFYHVSSCDVRTWPVKSYTNTAEACLVEAMVTRLLIRGISPDRIGVITPYDGQKKFVKLYMEEHGKLDTERYRKIEVNTVDAFQGREKDIIILTCVRSLGNIAVSSLNYFLRFHLVLTRAKFGLVIVGNSLALSKQDMWKNLLRFSQQHGVLVEGELDSLKPLKRAKFL